MSLAAPWISARAAITPERTALELDGATLDYGRLQARAERLAAGLRARGVGEADLVAALLPAGVDFVALLHAVDLCDAALLPLNLRLTPRELAYQLRDSRAALLVHDDGERVAAARSAAEAADGLACARVSQLTAGAGEAPALAKRDGSATLAVLYTSGTSGRPKGVRLTRDNFLWSAVASAFHLGVSPDDRWLACLPLFHVGGLSILLRSVLAGSAALVHERFDARAVSDALDRERVTLVSLTATTLHRLLDARGERPAPPALRCLLLGGGPCPPALLDRAAALGFPVAPTYGLTEAASQVATAPPGERALVPLLGTAVRVVDAAGRPLGPDRAGEIEVRGPTVTPGYVAPGAGSPLRDGWLRTGDVGEVDARGRLRVHDRRSDLIVSGGENVYPAEVEAALLDHPDLSEAGVVGRPDAEFGSRPVAWLVARGGAQRPDAEALRRFCRERLAGYKVPVAFHWAEALPRNASGKLLRRELPD